MREHIQNKIIEVIRVSLNKLGLKEEQYGNLYLDLPADRRFGDLASNTALKMSKVLKKPPMLIAQDLASMIKEEIASSDLKEYIKDVKAEGAGFLNFYFSDRYFYEGVSQIAEKAEAALKTNIGGNKKVLIEFVSANPTGPLSVAHARQAAVGDVLANILNFTGYKAKKEYYLNDEGNQIEILGKSVGLRIRELNGEQVEFPENHYQGQYIYDIAAQAIKDHCKQDNLSEYAADYILKCIKKELEDFGVSFDTWYSQKALRKSGKINATLEKLKENGFIYEHEGAVWLKSTSFGDDKDRVVIKSDTSFTYLAPDIAYHQDKYARGFDWLIDMWGPDHHGYIKRLKASIQAFGKDPESLTIIIVQLASIFKDGKSVEMSTRRGQYITLREVLDEVGRDASRFFFLMRKTSSHLDFDLTIAKKQTSENPVYYVQYAYARISSILKNTGIKIKNPGLDLLKEPEESALMKEISLFAYILNICVSTQDPYMLTVYLQELAESFHKFYDKHRVLGQDESLTKARVCLLLATKTVIATGLKLLGVSLPDKM
ncbi:MAG: arginine--tRNA ligase [Candidatus Omnitrophota bacterium]|jgi:arginyl-tRNA synthetase|nr:MAG: arginine--tRNA ligase [Candidatus Omnitrophota bacterium]